MTVIATGLNEEDEESFTDHNMQEQMNFVRDRVVSNQIDNSTENKAVNKGTSKENRQVFGDNNLEIWYIYYGDNGRIQRVKIWDQLCKVPLVDTWQWYC